MNTSCIDIVRRRQSRYNLDTVEPLQLMFQRKRTNHPNLKPRSTQAPEASPSERRKGITVEQRVWVVYWLRTSCCGAVNPIQENSSAMFHPCPRLFGRPSNNRSQKKIGPYTHEMRTNVIRRLATQQHVAQHKRIPHLVPSESKVTAISGSPTDVL